MNLPRILLTASLGLPLASASQGQTIAALAHMHPGTTILVQSTVTSASLGMERRCRFLRFAADEITCRDPDRRKIQYTLPLAEVEAVFRVKRVADRKRITTDAAIGALVLGGATGFTDGPGGANVVPLLLAGAGIGALIGFLPKHNDFKHETTEVIYQRPTP